MQEIQTKYGKTFIGKFDSSRSKLCKDILNAKKNNATNGLQLYDRLRFNTKLIRCKLIKWCSNAL